MVLQHWLLFLHIVNVVVWFGAGVTLSLIGLSVRQSSDRSVVAAFARTLRLLGLRAFMPAMVLVLLTGLAMVLDASRGRILQPWILIGLVLFLLAFLIGAIVLSRASIGLDRAVADPKRDLREATLFVGRWVRGYAVILVLLLVAVWDMVFKPFH